VLTARETKVLATIAGACSGALCAIFIVAAIGFAQHSDERDERAARQAQDATYAQLSAEGCRMVDCDRIGK
jgi:hypothetical protein